MNKSLREWTPGERLWLWRRLAGLNQRDAARNMGMGVTQYQLIETDIKERTLPPARPPVPLAGDLCALARRRLRMNLRDLARRLNVSHSTILKWEHNNDRRLVDHYKRHGFRFV